MPTLEEVPGVDAREEVLVVPRDRLLARGPVHGLSRDGLDGYLAAIAAHATFRARGEVEQDPSWKQIIPYLVIRSGDGVFLFQRTSSGGEARLYGRHSIGVGGHINRADVEGEGDPVRAGLRRELEEELEINTPWTARLIGVLNDDLEPVGQVHFGLVFLVETNTPDVRVREAHALCGGFVPAASLAEYAPRMESWSRLIVEAVDLSTV